MRFLRFCGSTPADFHRYIFSEYLRKTVLFSLGAVLPAAAFPLAVLFGTAGPACLAAAALAGAGAVCLVNILRKRKTIFSFGR
jgi:hypothetical protein